MQYSLHSQQPSTDRLNSAGHRVAQNVIVVVVVVVDLYSASRSASNALLDRPSVAKRLVFSADLKLLILKSWSRSECGSDFHSIRPATEKPDDQTCCDGVVEPSTAC